MSFSRAASESIRSSMLGCAQWMSSNTRRVGRSWASAFDEPARGVEDLAPVFGRGFPGPDEHGQALAPISGSLSPSPSSDRASFSVATASASSSKIPATSFSSCPKAS